MIGAPGGYARAKTVDHDIMINTSPLPSPRAHPPPATEPPTLRARLFPYLLLTAVVLLISICTA